jgi:hypothetical protein
MGARFIVVLIVSLGCGTKHHGNSNGDSGSGSNQQPDACVGAQCQVVNCAAMGKSPTTITGTVYAPNGTLPLYGINVYAPSMDPGPIPPGLQCNQCSDVLPGIPVGQPQQTDTSGKFTLTNVPSGSNVEVVITSGKWRRILKLPSVTACSGTTMDMADTTLPKSMTDMTANTVSVSMPKIAISTGAYDALECLVLKLGIADTEITTSSGSGHVNLFADTQSAGEGTKSFLADGSAWPGGTWTGGTGTFADSQTGLWNNMSALVGYDILINSCEGQQYSNTKSQTEMNNVKAYADMGGRVFLSHWHNIWIEGSTQGGGTQAPMVWTSIATWNNSSTAFDMPPDTIDEVNNPKGSAFATWMLDPMVAGSTVRDQIVIGAGTGGNETGKVTASSVDEAKAERWVYWTGSGAAGSGGGSDTYPPQNFQFTTPNEDPTSQRCGKVVFSDMHVSGDSSSATNEPYPSGCSGAGLTPQEKAIAFMFFDIASCVSTVIE